MKRKDKIKVRLEVILLLSIMLLSSFIFNYSMNNSNISTISENEDEIDTDVDLTEAPKSSVLGNDTWWDKSFHYRRLINVTNIHSVSFTDFGTSVSFNYEELGDRIQDDLDDIRIVENGILRGFYVVKDYPDDYYATVWFDTNISAGPNKLEQDTYMYYGNPTAVNSESKGETESLGWIKNGDFEFDTNDVDSKYIPYGWNFTDDPINKMQNVELSSKSIPNEPYNNTASGYSYENFVYRLTSDTTTWHGIGNGDYAYKWGTPDPSVVSTASFDYVGTLFTYPFKVPIVEGGSGKISLNFWRNVRTYIFLPSNTLIDYDGFYIRLLNGSADKYTHDVDAHYDSDIHNQTNYDNYFEAYGGNAKYAARWQVERSHQLREHHAGELKNTFEGDLTGYCTFDLTPYMGQEIFFEFGSWGREDGTFGVTKDYRSAFFQVDDLKFNYTLTAVMDEIQRVDSSVKVVAVDVDGRLVPNVEIFIVNNTNIVNSSVASDGTIKFYNVPRGRYNITANYTLGNEEVEVFNSFSSGIDHYYFNGINYTIQIQLDLWTIDFEIVDWDGIPLKYGYIEVNDSYGAGSTLLQNLILDDNGKATFRWRNTSYYYYKVYYKNDDYTMMPVALNESYIRRIDYIQNAEFNAKSRTHTINVYESRVGNTNYSISERIYTNGSKTTLGNKKINKINITLANMENYLSDISVYYIDKGNYTDGNLIYSETYPNEIKNDFIQLDISLIENDNLKSDNFEAYGLLIIVNGYNATTCNGVITVSLTETCNIYNKSALARINIKTIFYNEVTDEEDELSALIKVVDHTATNALINLTSTGDAIAPLEDGYAYGQTNEVPFWYLIGRVFNFSIDVGNETNLDFNITYISGPGPSQWIPGSGKKIDEYNYTLYGNSSITFFIIPEMGLNFTDFDSAFNNSYGESEAYWGEELDYWVYFLFTDDGWVTSDIVEKPPANVKLDIKVTATGEILFTKELTYEGIDTGIFSITIDSAILSAGNGFEYYTFEITGYHPTYDNPAPITFLVKVKAIPTSIASYNYDSRLLLPNSLYAEQYDELLNITIAYNTLATGEPLVEATVTYSWDIGTGTLESDRIWGNYFTATINTADALSTGIKIISVTASYENYSSAPLTIYLNVLKRATTLNNNTGLVYSNPKIWVQEAHYYNFTYRDAKTTNIISNLDLTLYSWQELDESGTIIAGKSGSGTLTQNAENTTYTLYFNTELRSVGFYQMYITLGKENYEERFALINLEIMLREFDADLEAKGLEDDQINIVKGDKVKLEIELLDETNEDIPLTGAKVVLDIGGKEYEFDEDDPGIYTYTFDTKNYEAFFTSKTFTGEIIIKKANFTSDEIDITIVVEMEEISEGVPTFYFIMVVAAISAVIGSLVSYRIIQQARIPKHVKRIREVKKKIKARDSIPKSLLVPSKEEFIVKQLGEAYSMLGVSLEKILGIKGKKSKPSAEIKDKLKKEGGEA